MIAVARRRWTGGFTLGTFDLPAPPEPVHELHPAICCSGAAVAPAEPRRSFEKVQGWLTNFLHPPYTKYTDGAELVQKCRNRRSNNAADDAAQGGTVEMLARVGDAYSTCGASPTRQKPTAFAIRNL